MSQSVRHRRRPRPVFRPVRPAPLIPLRRRVASGLTGLVLGGLLGAGLDFAVSLLRAFAQPHSSGQLAWLFVWVLAGVGALLGGLLGSQAGEFFGRLLNPLADDQSNEAGEWLMRVMIKGLGIALLLWALALWFTP